MNKCVSIGAMQYHCLTFQHLSNPKKDAGNQAAKLEVWDNVLAAFNQSREEDGKPPFTLLKLQVWPVTFMHYIALVYK